MSEAVNPKAYPLSDAQVRLTPPNNQSTCNVSAFPCILRYMRYMRMICEFTVEQLMYGIISSVCYQSMESASTPYTYSTR